MKIFIIRDDNGKDFTINNLIKFYNHILEFHSHGISIHEEDGHYFTVNEKFRKKIEKLVKNSKY